MPVRSARSFYLHVGIPGWQGRLLDYYDVELRDALTHETVLALTPAQAVAMLTNYVNHASITASLLSDWPSGAAPRAPLASAPSRAALRAVVGVPLRPVQQARADARRARKRKTP